ncbi:hypothetical protein [Blattabacterium cuenoti]|uniref:hypothetical protein n=1 Tax=Blattabacterium cuenoti TaxID=1653831 RepID=UPI00163BB1BB|nr:hypothetical protein [Blattabacterium cuenoti]
MIINNKYTKTIISILIFLLSIFFFVIKKNYLFSFILFTISLLFLFFVFKNEFLLMAFIKAGKKDMKGLEKYLGYIKNPYIQLTKNQIAYFYFLNGILFLEKDINKSEFYIKKSLVHGLKFKYNIAIAKLNLAIVYLSKGNKEKAKLFLLEAKNIDKSGILRDQINIVKNQIKKSNIGFRNIQNPVFRNFRKRL